MQIVCNTIVMNHCNDLHDPKYKITYRPAQNCAYSPEWKVCDWCYSKKYFNNLETIKSITKIVC